MNLSVNKPPTPVWSAFVGVSSLEKRWSLVDDTDDDPTGVSYKKWQLYLVTYLLDAAHVYMTLRFRSMTRSLLRSDNESALNLLRSRFVGYLDTVLIGGEDEDLAESPVSQGVLVHPGCQAVSLWEEPRRSRYGVGSM